MTGQLFSGRSLSGRGRPGMWLIWTLLSIVALALVTMLVVVAWAVTMAGRSADGSTPPESQGVPGVESTMPPEQGDPPDDEAGSVQRPSDALDALKTIETVSGESELGYDRGQFGQAWLDVDRNGCDTRNDILGRDLADPVFKENTNDCKVLSGTLTDPYNGEVVEFVSGQNTSVLVQIDHVVPLAWAWRHGAENWTMDRRAEFANDPRNLVASSQETNQSKGASGPSAWLPPVRDLQCGYAEDWVEVLDVYDLGINAADRSTLEGVLLGC